MCGDVCDARFVGLGGLTCAAASGEDIVFVGGEDAASRRWIGPAVPTPPPRRTLGTTAFFFTFSETSRRGARGLQRLVPERRARRRRARRGLG